MIPAVESAPHVCSSTRYQCRRCCQQTRHPARFPACRCDEPQGLYQRELKRAQAFKAGLTVQLIDIPATDGIR